MKNLKTGSGSRFTDKFVNSLNKLRILVVLFYILPDVSFVHINHFSIKPQKYLKLSACALLVLFALTQMAHAKDLTIENATSPLFFVNGTSGMIGINTTSPAQMLTMEGKLV